MTCPDSDPTRTTNDAIGRANREDLCSNPDGGDASGPVGEITRAGATTRNETVAGTMHRGLEPGESLDHFVLIRPLGEGGFGQVWLATDVRLGREVAIKLPHRRLAPGTVEARRFQREAEIAAKLTHPNLVPILEAVLDDDLAYIVSEYCPGPTLCQWLRDRSSPVPPRLAVSIVAQLADGLRVAHERGLIHRDIKPSNIILTESETEFPVPRLTDFGLARIGTDASDTHVGALIGSGPYMSPEQAAGNTDDHGPHSDVHALGVLLYELLTGETPFASVSELDTIRRIVSQDPPSVRQRRPSLSRDISAVCQHCLEKQPSRRYRNAGELLDDLRRVLGGHPPHASPVGHVGRTWRWATRNRGLAAMAGAAVGGLIIGVVGLSALAIEAQRNATSSEAYSIKLSLALATAQEQRAFAERQRGKAEDAQADALEQQRLAHRTRERSRAKSYTSDLSIAYSRLHQGHLGEARKLLDRQIPQAGEVDHRAIEWKLLESEVSSRYSLWGRHAGRGTELAILPPSDDATRPATVVSAALDGFLSFWDAGTGRKMHELTGLDGRLDAIAAMPSGELAISGPSWLLFGWSVVLIDPTSGVTLKVLHAHPTTIESIRVSSDASIIASASRYQNIRCWSSEHQRSISIENGTRNLAFGLTSDGARLLTSHRNPDSLQLWDTRTGALIDRWKSRSIGQVTVAHQHPYAAYEVGSKKGFGLVKTDDLSQRRWINSSSHPNAIEFSANDQFLAVANNGVGVELFERVSDEANGHEVQSDQPPEYRSVAYVAGLGGRIEDIKFIGPTEFVTISIDGAVERFAPCQSTHAVQTIAATDSHTMLAVEGPTGVLTLSQTGELAYFRVQPDATARTNEAAAQSLWHGKSSLTSVAVTDDDGMIAVTDRNGKLHLLTHWRDQTTVLQSPTVRTIEMPSLPSTDDLGMSCFSVSGRYLAIMGNPSELVVYDLHSDMSEPTIRRSYENRQFCLAFSPDERSLFICGFAGTEMIDLATDRSRFRLPSEDFVRTACFSPQGDRLFVGLRNGSIACLDQETGEVQFTLHSIDVMGSHSDQIESMCFLDNSKLMTVGPEGTAHFWNVDQRVQQGSFPVIPPTMQGTQCKCLDISRKGDALLIALDRSTVTDVHRWTWPIENTPIENTSFEDAPSDSE